MSTSVVGKYNSFARRTLPRWRLRLGWRTGEDLVVPSNAMLAPNNPLKGERGACSSQSNRRMQQKFVSALYINDNATSRDRARLLLSTFKSSKTYLWPRFRDSRQAS